MTLKKKKKERKRKKRSLYLSKVTNYTNYSFRVYVLKCCAGLGENVSTEVKGSEMDASRVVLKRDMAT